MTGARAGGHRRAATRRSAPGADLKAIDSFVPRVGDPGRPARLHAPDLAEADDRRDHRAGAWPAGSRSRCGATCGSPPRRARFGCLERRWGVPLIDGGTQRLPRIVGEGRALDLILTGRTVDAEEALAIGLVDRGGARPAATSSARSSSPSGWPASRRRRCSRTAARCSRAAGAPLDEGLAIEAREGASVADGRRPAAPRASRPARGAAARRVRRRNSRAGTPVYSGAGRDGRRGGTMGKAARVAICTFGARPGLCRARAGGQLPRAVLHGRRAACSRTRAGPRRRRPPGIDARRDLRAPRTRSSAWACRSAPVRGSPTARSPRLTFTAPAGTTIADFRWVRTLAVLQRRRPAARTRLYVLYALGGTPFYGSGDYQAATVNRLTTLEQLARDREHGQRHEHAAQLPRAGRLQTARRRR